MLYPYGVVDRLARAMGHDPVLDMHAWQPGLDMGIPWCVGLRRPRGDRVALDLWELGGDWGSEGRGGGKGSDFHMLKCVRNEALELGRAVAITVCVCVCVCVWRGSNTRATCSLACVLTLFTQ